MDSLIEKTLKEVSIECSKLLNLYSPPFHSYHEAYAVIKEELDEFWDCVKSNNEEGMKEELIQVAATAIVSIWLWECKNTEKIISKDFNRKNNAYR